MQNDKDKNKQSKDKKSFLKRKSIEFIQRVTALKKPVVERASQYIAEQEKIHGATNDIYILKLFFIYCFHSGWFHNAVLSYAKKFEQIGFLKLLDENPDFCDLLKENENVRQHVANRLYQLGFNMKTQNIYELNGGQFDTVANSVDNVITKYGDSLNIPSSTLVKRNNKLYKLYKDTKKMEEIPEGSTFIIKDDIVSTDNLSLLNTLSGTKNTLFWYMFDLDNKKYVIDHSNLPDLLVDGTVEELFVPFVTVEWGWQPGEVDLQLGEVDWQPGEVDLQPVEVDWQPGEVDLHHDYYERAFVINTELLPDIHKNILCEMGFEESPIIGLVDEEVVEEYKKSYLFPEDIQEIDTDFNIINDEPSIKKSR